MSYDLIVIGTGPGGYVRHPRRAAWLKVAGYRQRATQRRHVPQCRLHPVEGAAARLRTL